MESKMNQQYREQHKQKPTGEVTIEKDTTGKKHNNSYDGDYVDFEEVD